VRNTKAALKANGIALINEISGNHLFAHLTFGLLEGWWLYEDAQLRIPGCPGLAPASWQALLESEGWRGVGFPAAHAHALGQQVVVAESDGMIRQRPALPAPVTPASPRQAVVKASRRPLETNVTSRNTMPSNDEPRRGQPVRSAKHATTEDAVLDIVRACVEKVLKLGPDDYQDDIGFSEFGVDSILAGSLISAINERCKLDLKTSVLFDYSTVNKLAKHIAQDHAPQLPQAGSAEVGTRLSRPRVLDRPKGVQRSAAEKVAFPTRFAASAPAHAPQAPVRAQGPIAVIGMSGRFAKSANVAALWANLAAGTDLMGPTSRWEHVDYGVDQAKANHGSFVDGVDEFDPLFFHISGREAAYMDPQQRLFLEEAWNALEDAGYAGSSIEGQECGVYVGYTGGDYASLFQGVPPPQAMWGNSGSIIPARIAYHLNLHGPAIVVDTACSSSLVAVHLACQGLWNRETDMALAGGVSIQATPTFFVNATRAGMLSPSGRCYTFDERADGFVPGEGVGVVVLKRLEDAIADGDQIYGVISGSGINQDGATNGITAPSALSQERLERSVYTNFGIDPAEIQMVEAHGTGTRLGDPIECRALTKAFRTFTDKSRYCALGSIKTNIGHTLCAAGVAGLIKVLLSLKHRQIPASLNYSSTNPGIELDDSPFYVNTSLKPWDVEAGGTRRAAISSFGFSGTNAHAVVEEAPQLARRGVERPGYLIVLSARSPEQLQAQAARLNAYCGHDDAASCGDVSFTLLLGRRHFEHRLACVVHSLDDLSALLSAWLKNGKHPRIHVGAEDKRRREQVALKRFANECLERCSGPAFDEGFVDDLLTVAELFVQGYDFDFSILFGPGDQRRVSLPTYPFAKERYWVDEGTPGPAVGQAPVSALHPLVHVNTSSFAEQSFRSTFSGHEFFFSDHVVDGRKMLPGAAYLEMARAAMAQAAGELEGDEWMRLGGVTWQRPIVAEAGSVQVQIGLAAQDDGVVGFSVYAGDGRGDERLVHSAGSIAIEEPGAPVHVDLEAIRNRCPRAIPGAQCYALFNEMRIAYGPRFQSLHTLLLGDGEALAKLVMPANVAGDFVLHPSMIDGALQATIGLLREGHGAEAVTAVPFAVREVEVRGPCTPTMWSLARFSDEDDSAAQVRHIDVDLFDENGLLCVRLAGFSARVLRGPALPAPAAATVLMRRGWEERTAATQASSAAQRLIVLCALETIDPAQLMLSMPGALCVSAGTGGAGVADAYGEALLVLLDGVKALSAKPGAMIQVVVPALGPDQMMAGLGGLLAAMRLEYPSLAGQVICVEPEEELPALVRKLDENAACPADQYVRYEAGVRSVATWKELPAAPVAERPWRDGGVYLITGGAGGLGRIVAREIASACDGPALVLAGRRALNPDIQLALDELSALGARTTYLQVDVGDSGEVSDAINKILNDFGSLHGIVHSAGVHVDSIIHHKTAAECEQVLRPKVQGLLNLDLATKSLPLDVFICFSAGAAVFGNVGQSDYAAANAFMDVYAGYRNTLVALEQRHGRTVAINWPLWQDGGMRMSEQAVQRMERELGLTALSTRVGIDALYLALASGEDQILVLARAPAAQAGGATAAAPMKDVLSELVDRVAADDLSEEEFMNLLMREQGIEE
jgi:polyketide synthase PksN